MVARHTHERGVRLETCADRVLFLDEAGFYGQKAIRLLTALNPKLDRAERFF
jgi:hypothetical protein